MDKLQLMQSLAKVLGWGDMQSSIAIPAIEEMINTHIARIAEVSGDVYAPEDCEYLLKWKSDDLFGLLMPCEDVAHWNPRKYHDFLAMRGEIEGCMLVGYSHKKAIEECLR